MQRIGLILSGPLCAGKSALAAALGSRHAFRVVSAREVLRARAPLGLGSRTELQEAGRTLEKQTQGKWLVEAVMQEWYTGVARLVVDAVRTELQSTRLTSLLGPSGVLLHLAASLDERRRRFEARKTEDDADRGLTFDQAVASEIDLDTDRLRLSAELVIDTTRVTTTIVESLVAAYVGGIDPAL